jgi:hypothetical protein
MSMVRVGTVLVAAAALILGRAVAADDDLAVVKRATRGAEQAAPEGEKAGPTPHRSTTTPQWLKVRIVDKNGKKSRVSVNVPLALVQALGDECPIDWHLKPGRNGEPRKVRLSDVLKTLQAGQEIVQIEDDDATVRVWVE